MAPLHSEHITLPVGLCHVSVRQSQNDLQGTVWVFREQRVYPHHLHLALPDCHCQGRVECQLRLLVCSMCGATGDQANIRKKLNNQHRACRGHIVRAGQSFEIMCTVLLCVGLLDLFSVVLYSGSGLKVQYKANLYQVPLNKLSNMMHLLLKLTR